MSTAGGGEGPAKTILPRLAHASELGLGPIGAMKPDDWSQSKGSSMCLGFNKLVRRTNRDAHGFRSLPSALPRYLRAATPDPIFLSLQVFINKGDEGMGGGVGAPAFSLRRRPREIRKRFGVLFTACSQPAHVAAQDKGGRNQGQTQES